MSNEGLNVAVAELLGFIRLPSGTPIREPLKGMELVCGNCRAVVRCTERYNWNVHEHCGPMGCDCYGGGWKLFSSVWLHGDKVRALPDYCNDLNAMHEAEKIFTFDQWNAYVDYLIVMPIPAESPFRGYEAIHSTATQRAEAFVKTFSK